MIVTDRFIFIHLHKTGGQTLNDAIASCLPKHEMVGYHFPRADIPAEHAELPVVGIVRNPWDWYTSWYAFNRRPNIRNPLFNAASNGGTEDFKSTITNLVRLGSDDPECEARRGELIRLLPDSLDGNRGVGLTKNCVRDLATSKSGYYSWLFERMFGDTSDDHVYIGRFENLKDNFLDIMQRLSVAEIDTLRSQLDTQKRKNVSRHSHYSHYFDDELHDLVATMDHSLIQNFDYSFECVKPPEVSYKFPSDAYEGPNGGFRKLLGRENNFLPLQSDFPVAALREKLEQLPAARWLESERERLFDVHRDTQALLLVHYEDHKYDKPEYRELYDEFRELLEPAVDLVADYYKNNGFVVRLILAKLLAGGRIPKHTDAGYSLLNCHRVHLPIITNNDVGFFVGGETINMQAGEFWEINNGTVHAVENRGSEDRVHLIIDWMPNSRGLTESEVLAPGVVGEPQGDAANAANLDAMLQRAHQMQQTGHLAKAESLYRQVVHFDENHVIGNNLLGLLCLQTQRNEEAVTFIETALRTMPNDAQAHANLGLALKNLGRAKDAIGHFEESLRLAPNNPRTYSNFGSMLVELGKIRESVPLFQQALAIHNDFPEAHFNLGCAFLHLRKYNEAAASLIACLALKPDFAEAEIKLAETLKERDKPH